MAVYFVTGSLGGGKSLCAVDRIRQYLLRGRKVATNMNLHLEHICNADNNYTRVIRIPDAPTIADLSMIGFGSDEAGDKNHGLLVLDELGTWFNARDFSDKSRKDVIKYCIHLRKRRWDVLFIVQDVGMVDKQIRGNITQYLVFCQSSHDMWLLKLLPKFHVATVRLRSKIKVDSWWYRGRDLFPMYDTEQLYQTSHASDGVISVDEDMDEREKRYMQLNGLYTLLPPAYLGADVQASIRQRITRIKRGKRNVWVFAALLVVNWFAWLYGPASGMLNWSGAMLGQQEISADAAGDALASPDASAALSFRDLFEPLKIHSYVRFGDDYRYRFADEETGIHVEQAALEQAGVVVRSRGPDEVLLVSPTREFVRVFQ